MLGPAISTAAVVERVRGGALAAARAREPGRAGLGVQVNAFWVVTAAPAFASGWKAGALAVEEVEDRVPALAHRCVAFLATDGFVEAAELPGDPVGELLAGIDPFAACPPLRQRLGDGRWIEAHAVDGVSYEFEWCTMAVPVGRFWFGNPRTAPLLALERGLFELAARVGEQSTNPQAAACIEEWRKVVARRAAADPALHRVPVADPVS